jgi:hypothetical protein
MGGAVPAWSPSRPWTPLALTLCLHLLLVLAWLGGARGDLARQPTNGLAGKLPPASAFVLLRPPLRRAAPEPAAAAVHPPPRRLRPPAALAVPPSTPAVTAARTAPATTAGPGVSVPAFEPAAGAKAQAKAQADAQTEAAAPAALPGELLARSKAMAGPVDRELRKGGSPITAEPERKWERFAAAFAAARKDASRSVTLDSYTAPDGVVVYRKTVGGRVSCYRSGSVGGLVTGFGSADGQGAGTTSCPTGVSWTRH